MDEKVFILTTTEDVIKEFNAINKENLDNILNMYKTYFTPEHLTLLIKKGNKCLEELLQSVDKMFAINGFDLKMIYENYGSEEPVYQTKGVAKLFALFGYKNKSIIINEDDEIYLIIFTHPENSFSFTLKSIGTLICPPYGTDMYTDIVVLDNTAICIS